jgi:hypothetical protein
VGAALAAIGLPAVLVGPRSGDRRAARRSAGDQAVDDAPPNETPPDGHPANGRRPGRRRPGDQHPDEEPSGGHGQPVAGPHEPEPISGPAYRIAGRRRLARLAELVGERPTAAPPDAWPH